MVPEVLTLSRYHDSQGNFTIFIRLTDRQSNGVEATVSIRFENHIYQVKTDKNGVGIYKLPQKIPYGYRGFLHAYVNGIPKQARIKIENVRTIKFNSFSLKWFLNTHNGRVFIFLAIMIILWIYCISIGFGSSLLETTFHSQLSEQEKIYNSIIKDITPENMIKPPVIETWQHKYWLFAVLWTIFTFIYLGYALIKTLYITMIKWIESFGDSSEVKVSKPLFDIATLWTGVVDKATATKQEDNNESNINFWSIVKANLLSELILVLGNKVLKEFVK